MSKGNDLYSLEQLQNLADTVPRLKTYNKYKNTKQYSAIVSGSLTLLDFAKFATSIHIVDLYYLKGEEDEKEIENSRQCADELLESYEIFNKNLKAIGLQPIPEVNTDDYIGD